MGLPQPARPWQPEVKRKATVTALSKPGLHAAPPPLVMAPPGQPRAAQGPATVLSACVPGRASRQVPAVSPDKVSGRSAHPPTPRPRIKRRTEQGHDAHTVAVGASEPATLGAPRGGMEAGLRFKSFARTWPSHQLAYQARIHCLSISVRPPLYIPITWQGSPTASGCTHKWRARQRRVQTTSLASPLRAILARFGSFYTGPCMLMLRRVGSRGTGRYPWHCTPIPCHIEWCATI